MIKNLENALFVETKEGVPALEVFSDNVPTFEFGGVESSLVRNMEHKSPFDSFFKIVEMEKNANLSRFRDALKHDIFQVTNGSKTDDFGDMKSQEDMLDDNFEQDNDLLSKDLETLFKPFTKGFRRVLFRRPENNQRDVYYVTPDEEKVRSDSEVLSYLERTKETELDIRNFCFLPLFIGFGKQHETELIADDLDPSPSQSVSSE